MPLPNLLTHAVEPVVVQVVSKGALAAEGAVSVDANAIPTDAWVIQTLIHVCTQRRSEGERGGEGKKERMARMRNTVKEK